MEFSTQGHPDVASYGGAFTPLCNIGTFTIGGNYGAGGGARVLSVSDPP